MPDKNSELNHLQRFLSAMPHLATAQIEPGESPDFVIVLPTSRIGIEITRHSPQHTPGHPHPKEQDSLQQQSMAMAERLWYASQSVALDVSAQFLEPPPLTKARVPALAAEIVDYLASEVAALDLFKWAILRCSTDLPELHSLCVLRVPDPSYGVWGAGGGGWVRHATEADIRSLVASKEPKVGAYRLRAEEVWLLITLQHMDAGGVLEGPIAPMSLRLTTSFRRVFTLDIVSGRVVEIPIDRAA